MSPTLPSGTVTLLFTDIEESSRLWDTRRVAMPDALATHNDLLRDAISSNGGVVVKDKGDGYFAAFPTPNGAVQAALDAQRALRDAPWPEAIGSIRVRMAIHTGSLEPRDGDYHGPVVNRVARIEGIAHGGQVLVSDASRALVQDVLPDGVELRDLGAPALKGLSRTEHVHQLTAPDLPGEFPPLRVPAAGGIRLPEFPTSFVGRESERDELAALLSGSDCRLVTLLGPGGIGKTRLAVETARTLAPDFPGGAYFADLALVETVDGVGVALAQAVGAHPEGTASVVTLAADRITDPTLLVVDNFEHVAAAAPTVADLLAEAPQVRLLATSRTPLQIRGERVVRIEPLGATSGNGSLPPAVELFYDRAAASGVQLQRTGRDIEAVRSICRRVDGLPLAIELVAARARLLDVSELDALLHRSLDALGSGAADLPERHRTIRATIDWSLRSLTPGQRSLFNRLAVFPAGATLAQLGSVTGLDPYGSLIEELTALVDNSLVNVARGLPGGTRYGQLVPLREYGLELLAEAGDHHATMGLMVDHYVAAAPDLGARLEYDEDADAELVVDAPNLLAAMRWSVDNDRMEDLAGVTMALWEYWFHGDRLAPLVEWLDAADRALDGPVIDWIAGFVGFQQGDFEAASTRMARSREGFTSSGDASRAALATAFLGAMTWDVDEARVLLESARDHFAADVEPGLGWFLAVMFLSFNHVQRGDDAEAIRLRRELTEWAQRMGLEEMEGWARLNLAMPLITIGELDEAEEHLRFCLDWMVDAGFQEGVASAAELLAHVAARRGEIEHGVRLLGGTSAVYERLGVARWPEAVVAYEGAVAAARERLGETKADRLLAEGARLSIEELIDLVSAPA
jgi:predicted ATPase/class 3 adenylate cyclase